jgi:hypothetical protein
MVWLPCNECAGLTVSLGQIREWDQHAGTCWVRLLNPRNLPDLLHLRDRQGRANC